MADVHVQHLSEIRENSLFYDLVLGDIEGITDETKKALKDELDRAIFGDARLDNAENDPLIDARVVEMGGRYNISINASEMGRGDSISLGIVGINTDGTTRHRYPSLRIERSEEAAHNKEVDMAREKSEMEQLFDDSVERLRSLGYTLEEIEGTQMQYTIKDDQFTYGELLAGLDGNEVVNVMINNYNTGEFTDIGSMEDVQGSVDKFFAYREFNTPAPETETDTSFMEFRSRLSRYGYDLEEMEGGNLGVSYKGERLGIFNSQPDKGIGIVSRDTGQVMATVQMETALLHIQGLSAMKDEEIKEEKENPVQESISPLDEFINANKKGFYVHVGEDEKGPVAFGLKAQELEDFVKSRNIDASTVGEYSDKIAHALKEEYENIKENIVVQSKDLEDLDKEEKEIMQELNLTQEMTEKQMAEAVIDYVNDGREADSEQQEWINSHSDVDVRKESDVRKEELNELREGMSELKDEIDADKEKIVTLNKELDRQLSIAKMNGCGETELENIRNTVNSIKETTESLNLNRTILVGMEEQEQQKIAELNKAVRYERAQAVKGVFSKVHDTLKKGVDLGIGTLGKIRDGIEKVNIKVMEYSNMKERVDAYKDLAREVHDINREYVNEIQYLKGELERDTAELEKVTQKAERMAEIRGTIKDLGRLITGKEALHDYSISDADKSTISDLKGRIEDTKAEMGRVDQQYERTVAPKQQELKDWGKDLEEKGKAPKDFFKEKMQNAFDRAGATAKATHEELSASKDAR